MTIAAQYKLTEDLKVYLLPAMKMKFGDKCADCGRTENTYDIDHLRYSPDISMFDLQLLCRECHYQKTDIGNSEQLSKMPHCPSCMCYA
jgi:5-methylcytosine-specific restriction endonuclease McrA